MATNKQDKLRKLQEKYIAQLPDKLDVLNQTWLNAINDDTSELKQVRLLVHTLAGSAGTFGFPSVSIEARNLEEILRAISKDQGLTTEIKTNITDALQRIFKLVEQGPDNLEAKASVEYNKTPDTTEIKQLIYVIEDDELLATEIADQLSYYDYKTKTFSNTSSAIEAIKQHMPSVMIVDVHLQGSNVTGPEFTLLFNEFSTTHIPSIFISSRDDWQARLAAVRANGSAYLTKPIDFNDLLERLDLLSFRQVPEPLKVLIVDDMEELAEHYSIVLSNAGMQVKAVTEIGSLLETLSDFQPELILMDIYMPQCSGLEAAKIIRQKDELLSIPIVFLSTESDPMQHLTAMELGGDDFLQKPIEDGRLVVAVRSRAERFRRLRSHMHSDGLTGLLNHVTIKTHLEAEIARAQRLQKPLSYAMLDIDHFKQVNDAYGHPAGDRVIKSVARMLTKRLRKSDIIGRYGGEEFAIILPETDIDNAHNVLDDLRLNFSQIVQQNNEVQFNCTLSAGVTQMTPNDSVDSLIKTADTALYDAKHSGRNCVCIK